MRTKKTLSRIANALERIADVLEGKSYLGQTQHLNIDSVSLSEEQPIDTTDSKDCSEITESDKEEIITFLRKRNIDVKSYPEKEDVDASLISIAQYMGDKYSHIQKVYEMIKRHLNAEGGFKLDLKKSSQLDVSYSCQLCNMLYKIAFLSEYKYIKSPSFTLIATPNRIPIAINFLTGHWLELHIKKAVLDVLISLNQKISYSCIINPKIVLPNGDDFEFDVIYFIQGKAYWIEAKTASYQNYVDKYSKVALMLGQKDLRPYMVLTDLPQNNNHQILSKLFNMKVCYVEDFSNTFREDLILDLTN